MAQQQGAPRVPFTVCFCYGTRAAASRRSHEGRDGWTTRMDFRVRECARAVPCDAYASTRSASRSEAGADPHVGPIAPGGRNSNVQSQLRMTLVRQTCCALSDRSGTASPKI